MIRALNAGFGLTLTHELPALKALGVEGIRTDCQKLDAETTAIRAKEITDAGLVPLIVVATLEQLTSLPEGTLVEWKNEPDLEWKGQARAYGEQVQAFTEACDTRKLQPCAGVVSNLINRGFEYLQQARAPKWPEHVIVTAHWYPHKDSPRDPHPGFKSREHEVETLKTVIGNHRFGISEFGYRTNRPDAAASVSFDQEFWDRMGAMFTALYQLNDGLGKDEHWGIRGVDGAWKPVANSFKRIT